MSDPVLVEAVGTIDGVNVDFETADVYQAGTLWAYVNGILVEQDGDEGPIELGGNQVRMRKAPTVDSTLHFYYHTGPITPHAYPTPPHPYMSLDLVPISYRALDLVPVSFGIEVESDPETQAPDAYRALDLVPKTAIGLDLVPVPLSAEEE